MNLVFMNIDSMQESYDDLKNNAELAFNGDISLAFKEKLEPYGLKYRKKSSDKRARMKRFNDITPTEYFDIL